MTDDLGFEPSEQPAELTEPTEPPVDDDYPAAPVSTEEYDPELVSAVTAHQVLLCGQVVPDALSIRLAAAAQVPAGQWRRTAGGDDPEVIRLEAPHRLSDSPEPESQAPGSRRRRR